PQPRGRGAHADRHRARLDQLVRRALVLGPGHAQGSDDARVQGRGAGERQRRPHLAPEEDEPPPMKLFTTLLFAIALGARAQAQAPVRPSTDGFVEVVVPTTPDIVTLRLTSDQPADVAEMRKVALAAGRSRLRFDWSREHLDEGSLRFEVALANGSATLPERT